MAPHSECDARFRDLEDRLAEVTRRLQALEGSHARAAVAMAGADAPAALPDPPAVIETPGIAPTASDLPQFATLLGRTFIVFGGAYLLRALTESGRVPGAAGVVLGLVYALAWMAMAYRDALTRKASSQFHGITGLLIGLPLVWEATSRFSLLGPGSAALLLAALSGAGLAIARRGQLDALAAMAGAGTLAVTVVMAFTVNHWGAFSLLLIGLSTTTYWLSDMPGRAWLRWPNAVAAGLSVAAVTARCLATPRQEPVWLALLAQGLLLATMQGSLAVRVVILGRNVRFFDIMQAASGLAIGVGGAVLVARESSAGLGLIGAITLLLASGAYLAAIIRLSDRPHLVASFHTFATFGLVAATAALVLLFTGTALTLVALIVSMATIALGPRYLEGYAPLHGAAFVLTALAASGVLTASAAAWATVPAVWPSLAWMGWVTLVVTGVAATLPTVRAGAVGDLMTRIGRGTVAAAFVFGVSGAVILLLGPVLAGAPPDAGILASLRTALVSAAVILLGLSARWPQTTIFSRLVYPVIVLGAVRLVVDDFMHSRPATLFVALALFGVALTVGPRLKARHTRPLPPTQ